MLLFQILGRRTFNKIWYIWYNSMVTATKGVLIRWWGLDQSSVWIEGSVAFHDVFILHSCSDIPTKVFILHLDEGRPVKCVGARSSGPPTRFPSGSHGIHRHVQSDPTLCLPPLGAAVTELWLTSPLMTRLSSFTQSTWTTWRRWAAGWLPCWLLQLFSPSWVAPG